MKTRIISLLMSLLISMDGAVAAMCVAPPSGMVGWWPGDGNANDISDGNNDGSLIDDINFVSGKVDQAFTISGDTPGYVNVLNSSLLEPEKVTVDAWVKADQIPGPFRYIVAKGAKDCQAASYGLYTGPDSGLYFYVFDGTNTVVVSPGASTYVWNSEWHHVAGTYDGSDVILYLDGNLVGSTPTPTGFAIGYNLSTNNVLNNDLVIGNYLDNGTCPDSQFSFTGEIDEVELFNVALSKDDITNIYEADVAGKCKTIQVTIDIKPGSDINSINLASAGVIPVAIFSAVDFDATTIDPFSIDVNGATVKVTGNKNLKPLCNPEDVDGDGLVDLVCKIYTVDIVTVGESVAVLHGMTMDGRKITGQDFIRIVPEI